MCTIGIPELLEQMLNLCSSLNGEGNFNWRHVHEFEYLPAEELMVVCHGY